MLGTDPYDNETFAEVITAYWPLLIKIPPLINSLRSFRKLCMFV